MLRLAKISIIILLVFLFIPILDVNAQGNAILKLTSTKIEYRVGEDVYIDVEVQTNGEEINVVRAIMDITGDQILLIDDFRIGETFPNFSPGKTVSDDYVNVGGFILLSSVSEDFIFGTLIFKANKVGTSSINFRDGSHLISPDQQERLDLANSQGITINVLPSQINNNPVFDPQISSQMVNLGDTISFQVRATDPDNDNVSFDYYEIPPGAVFENITSGLIATGDFFWTPTQIGVYTALFTAFDDRTDNQSSTTMNVGISVSEPLPPLPPPEEINKPPRFDPVSEKTANAGEILTFNVTATDPNDDNVIITMPQFEDATLTTISSGVTSTVRFSWSPTSPGIYYVVFEATDDHPDNPLSKSLQVRILAFGGECPPCGGGVCEEVICEEQPIYIETIKYVYPPKISSPSHPDPSKWYFNNKPQFIWEIKEEGLGYSFNIDENSLNEPDYAYFFTEDKFFSFSEISDGFWYFHLKTKYEDGWGPTAHYQIKIDTTSPEFFKPYIETKVSENNQYQYLAYFAAIDQHSGIDYYEIKITENKWQKVTSPLVLNNLNLAGEILTIRAVDKVGNAIESYIDLINYQVIEDIEPAQYIIIEEKIIPKEDILILEPPLIDKVILHDKKGTIFVKDVLKITGTSVPNTKVTVYLTTDPETIFTTESDKDGFWVVYIDQFLEAGKYGIYSISSKDDINSLPSEMVHFTLTEKFTATSELAFPWLWIVIILILVVITLLILNRKLKHKLKEIIKKKKEVFKKNQDYEKNNKNNNF